MQRLRDWIELKELYHNGVKPEDIKKLEKKLNIKLPVAYKEYLEITGHRCLAVLLNHFFDNLEEMQKTAKQFFEFNDLDPGMIEKEYFVFAFDGDSDTILYFHFDEGDNPPVYILSCMNYEEYPNSKNVFGKLHDSFEDWVNRRLDVYTPNSYRGGELI